MHRHIAAIFYFGVTFLSAACSKYPSAPVIPADTDLLAAPDEILVENNALRLTSYPWRDFMPGVGETDTRLRAVLRIQAAQGKVVPSGLIVEQAWVIYDGDAWVWTPTGERAEPNGSALEISAGGGPTWPIGALVTAVVRARDARNNSYLLRAAPQAINRTD